MITFSCLKCKVGLITLKDIQKDVLSLKKDLTKVVNDNASEIKTHIDNTSVENNNEFKTHCTEQKLSFSDMVKKYQVPSIEKISNGVKMVIDTSALAAKEQDIRD